MLRLLLSLTRFIWGLLGLLVTGGRYRTSLRSSRSSEYAARQAQKRRDFETFGGRPCKICGNRIPGNRSYCGPCYFKYIKK